MTLDPIRADAPAFRIAENICTVVANDVVNADYRLLVLDAPPIALTVAAGQFFHLDCPAIGEERPFLRRPMSIYRVDRTAGRIEFLYKVTGIGTRGLATLGPGDTLDCFGPLGIGFKLEPGLRHVLMLSRGVGLATMAPLAEAAIAQGARVTAILSARAPDLIMSADYLRAVGAGIIAVHDLDGSSAVPAVERLIRELHARDPFDLLTTCGSNRLMLLLQKLGAELGIVGQVAIEQHMACGIGMCFCCVREFHPTPDKTTFRRVCIEGPVFDLQEPLSW
jgi:dihydroorotate dehydrogenase electron transfer subunit